MTEAKWEAKKTYRVIPGDDRDEWPSSIRVCWTHGDGSAMVDWQDAAFDFRPAAPIPARYRQFYTEVDADD